MPFVYTGTTELTVIGQYAEERRHTVLIEFTPLNFLGRADIWWGWHGFDHINYGEVKINDQISEADFDGIFLHEMACHILCMDHNQDTQNSICSGPPHTNYNSPEYQATLRLDDMKAIQSLYLAKPNRQGAITSFDGTNVCFYQPEIEYEGIVGQEIESCSNILDPDFSAIIVE